MEEEEVEVLDSSQSSSGRGTKEKKELMHVSITIRLGCVDLTQNQFPKTVNRVPSPITISSTIRVSSKDNANPSIV